MKRRTSVIFNLGLSLFTYLRFVRPRMRTWGAWDDEVRKRLPGDEFVPMAKVEATRAITIHAPAENIWCWLVQMGYDRAGWYVPQWADTFWDYVIRQRFRNTDWYTEERLISKQTREIIPEYQRLQVGDRVGEGPDGYYTIATLDPNRALVLHSTRHPLTGQPVDLNASQPGNYLDFSWAFILEPIDEHSTRLINRVRADYRLNFFGKMLLYTLFEPADCLMEWLMLQGIKERAEGMAQDQPAEPVAEPVRA